MASSMSFGPSAKRSGGLLCVTRCVTTQRIEENNWNYGALELPFYRVYEAQGCQVRAPRAAAACIIPFAFA